MTAPDFAAIIAQPVFHAAFMLSTEAHQGARAVLAAKVPELCQTCGGEGGFWTAGTSREGVVPSFVACLDCPTIGQLLAIGAAAWAWTDEQSAALNHYAPHVLDDLRAVQP